MRRYICVLSFLFLVGGSVFASTTTPSDLLTSSGTQQGTAYTNFSAVGENAVGVITSTSFRSGAGIAAMIYTPLIPDPGNNTPTIATSLGVVISYPNPFNPNTQVSNIAYRLAQDADVKIYIYDLSGSLIRLIVTNSSSRASDGYSRYAWDGKDGYGAAVANGTYLVRVVSGGTMVGSTKIMAVR